MLFRCKNCGGNAVYDPEKRKMFCPHCDGVESDEKEEGGNLTECANCGAPLTIETYNSTCRCEYCGSYIILDDRVRDNYRPEWVLPFKIGKKRAVEMLREEFKNRIFTPGSFLTESTLEDMKGVYVPFWLYDYKARYDYAGKGTKVRVWTSGDTEYTETSFYRVERDMDIDFDKIPVDASIAMPNDVMDLMEPFDYGQMEGFEESYMSGFCGEIYNMNAEELEERAKTRADADAEALMKETLAGYTTLIPERKDLRMDREAAHFALLPVWQYLYRYQGKEYVFHVNGQSGKISGSTPVSVKKVLAYGSTVFAALWILLSCVAGILEVL